MSVSRTLGLVGVLVAMAVVALAPVVLPSTWVYLSLLAGPFLVLVVFVAWITLALIRGGGCPHRGAS